jgi:Immunoglobulin-like domain of bacterial spore germination/LysM domain
MSLRLIEVRQPREFDLIGREFVIAGFATGFEASVMWQVLDERGKILGASGLSGVGSMGIVHDFGHPVTLYDGSARGAPVTLQVFGDDPSGQHPPGTDLNEIDLTLFSSLIGWRLWEVVYGDSLLSIARDVGEGIRSDDVFNANRDQIEDPENLRPGSVLRVPLLC